jgi:RHS repeat-associated protein
LNRLASAVTADNPNVTQWGQSYTSFNGAQRTDACAPTYDGFGNLTDQTLIKGTAPNVHVAYDPATNRQVGDTADLNGNIGLGYIYDLENRLVQPGSSSTARYAYDASNHRVWRGDTSVDELAFWSGSQKLATYQISTSGGLSFTLTKTYVYFGGKLISKGTYNSSGTGDKVTLAPVAADRLGSIGKFYPYGTERPSATMNDTEKFTGYFRDGSTGLDYADQRYHQPGTGRFVTPDAAPSASASDPGSWNRYAYVGGDPVNSVDPSGQYWIDVGFPNLFVWQPGIQDVAWLNVCDYYCEAGWAVAEYYLNLANQYNGSVSLLQPLQDQGIIDGYSVDFFSGNASVTLSNNTYEALIAGGTLVLGADGVGTIGTLEGIGITIGEAGLTISITVTGVAAVAVAAATIYQFAKQTNYILNNAKSKIGYRGSVR